MKKIKLNKIIADLSHLKYSQVFKQISLESDRGAVLITTSILDDILEEKIRSLCKVNKKDIDLLFTNANGPFNSFYAKIEFLYCFRKIPLDYKNDLHLIRGLRNKCAHNWETFEINTRIQNDYLNKFFCNRILSDCIKEIKKKEECEQIELRIDPRGHFLSMASLLIVALEALK